MVDNIKTYFRMLGAYARMDVLWFFRDTKYCLLWIMTDSIVSLSGVAGMFLLAQRFEGFGGYAQNEIMLMLGYAVFVNGLFGLFFTSNNTGQISRVIGRGQLDHVLIQPVPLPMYFLTSGIAPLSGCGPFLCGTALLLYAAEGVAINKWLMFAKVALMAPLSLVVFVSWIYIISALAFWAPYAAEEIATEASDVFTTLAPYPLGKLAQAAQFVLCAVLPVGTMAFVPSLFLLNKPEGGSAMALLAGVAAVALLLVITIYKKGLKHYAKYSCPRYTGFGRN